MVPANRTEPKAQALAPALCDLPPGSRCRTQPWTAEGGPVDDGTNSGSGSAGASLAPHDSLLLPHGCPAKDHLVYDMVYKPLVTPLIATARAAGAKAINDLPMLLWQGTQSIEWWFSQPAPVGAIWDGLDAAVASVAGI